MLSHIQAGISLIALQFAQVSIVFVLASQLDVDADIAAFAELD